MPGERRPLHGCNACASVHGIHCHSCENISSVVGEMPMIIKEPAMARLLRCPSDTQPTLKERNMASRKRGASRTQPLALELLISDHRNVEALFKQYEDNKEGDEETKRAIAQQVCSELTVHAQVEEELFYPWLRENLEAEDMEMVEEAEVEHATAKDLIAQIEAAGEVDAAYDARVKVLSEYIKHHVKEEEEEIFPSVRDQQEELDELGQEMSARKAELMEELGIASEEEPAQDAGGGERKRAGDGTKRNEQRGSR
jgi:hemerythrin-like domain-containing protein